MTMKDKMRQLEKIKNVNLHVKINVILCAICTIFFSTIIYLSYIEQRDNVKSEVRHASRNLAVAVYRGIIYPMSLGDGNAVRKELSELKSGLTGNEVLIVASNKTVTYASDAGKTGREVSNFISSGELERAVGKLLQENEISNHSYEEWINGRPYLTTLLPIPNESRCHQCHPATDTLRGGLIVRQSLDTLYEALTVTLYKNLAVGGAGTLIFLVVLYLMVEFLIMKPVGAISLNLSEGAEQLLAAVKEITAASQEQADGATSQAAGIEETSASLEEMSAMTRKNSDNAGQADRLMKEANNAVREANEVIASLTSSMAGISQASEETSKIVKTIDEIAFQTNLLALNAAVEAARAGEAGAGFAVVANEVRNLALRAAQAAKTTAQLIEGTVTKIKEGSNIVTRTNRNFSELAGYTEHACELASEITLASQEQAQGIDQISNAVADIDRIIQANAASAEQLAAASKEFAAVADQTIAAAEQLGILMGGSSSSGFKERAVY